MPFVPGLRSPYDKVGRVVYFGRMLDKIRLQAAGMLPAAYVANLGDARPGLFDGRFCRFFGVDYRALVARTLAGGSDEEILAWVHAQGTPRSDEECGIWNRFLSTVGWRDDLAKLLHQRIQDYGLEGRPIETMFDLIDYDEGRDPAATQPWKRLA